MALVEVRLLAGLVEQTVKLGLHLGIRWAEFVALVFARIGADVVQAGGLQSSFHEVGRVHQPAGLVDMRLALLHDRQALGRIGDDVEGEFDVDLIPGGLQKLTEELSVRSALADALELQSAASGLLSLATSAPASWPRSRSYFNQSPCHSSSALMP